MKKTYETAEANVVLFDKCDVITASGGATEDIFTPSYDRGDDETEIL